MICEHHVYRRLLSAPRFVGNNNERCSVLLTGVLSVRCAMHARTASEPLDWIKAIGGGAILVRPSNRGKHGTPQRAHVRAILIRFLDRRMMDLLYCRIRASRGQIINESWGKSLLVAPPLPASRVTPKRRGTYSSTQLSLLRS